MYNTNYGQPCVSCGRCPRCGSYPAWNPPIYYSTPNTSHSMGSVTTYSGLSAATAGSQAVQGINSVPRTATGYDHQTANQATQSFS